jgi:hypothetical protein
MFQLKSQLERNKLSHTHDSLPIPSVDGLDGAFTPPDNLAIEKEKDRSDDGEGMGLHDAAVFVNDDGGMEPADAFDSNSTSTGAASESGMAAMDVDQPALMSQKGGAARCDGKPETGNRRRLRARFGRKRTHNEELCVTSCGVILGRATFYGSEAPNGIRVSIIY